MQFSLAVLVNIALVAAQLPSSYVMPLIDESGSKMLIDYLVSRPADRHASLTCSVLLQPSVAVPATSPACAKTHRLVMVSVIAPMRPALTTQPLLSLRTVSPLALVRVYQMKPPEPSDLLTIDDSCRCDCWWCSRSSRDRFCSFLSFGIQLRHYDVRFHHCYLLGWQRCLH